MIDMFLLNNKIKMFSICFMILISALVTQITYAECGPKLNEGIQKIIDEDRIKYQIPGIQVSISCPGEENPRDFVSGTTTIDGAMSVKPENLFQIGSETKSFTSVILLKLEADGILSINDPIGKWLPNISPDWKNITIKQLLNHTSGIFNYAETDEFWSIEKNSGFKKQWAPDELINLVVNKSAYFKPGKGWHYSNTNYVLAGMIIQAATGKLVEEKMNTLLLEPLHLTNTFYLPYIYSNNIIQRMAHGYHKTANDPLADATNYNMSMADAAGAIISTSHDTAIWLRRLLTTDTVLPAAQRKELMSLVDMKSGQELPNTNNISGYGLGIGFDYYGEEIWGHDGGTLGYLSNMLWLKCNDVVVTSLINISSDDNVSGDLISDLVNYIQKSDNSKQCDSGSKLKAFLLMKNTM